MKNTDEHGIEPHTPIYRSQSAWRARLPDLVNQLLNAGTASYPPEERNYLVAANVTGYLAAISSLCYAISYTLQDFTTLRVLVFGNILSAVLTASVPLAHRFGRSAGGILITVTIFSTIFYFIYILGRESGIQLNYLAAAAIAFLILGIQRIKLVILIIVAGALLHIMAWFMFPTGQLAGKLPHSFLSQTYVFSAVSITAIITLVVYYVFQLLRREQARSNALLLNILPVAIAERLKTQPNKIIAERHEAVTVLFADICGFTPLTARLDPQQLIALLDKLFSAFDAHASRLGVEKIKTIGDAYMVVSGLPASRPDHAAATAELALAMMAATQQISKETGHDLSVRIGIAAGPVTAGVIGRSKFAYDVWGETVNRAARLEASGQPEDITIDEQAVAELDGSFELKPRGEVQLKGIGSTRAWFLKGSAGHA